MLSNNTFSLSLSLSRRLVSKRPSTAEAALRPGSETLRVSPIELVGRGESGAALLNILRDIKGAVTTERIDKVLVGDTDDGVSTSRYSFEINPHLLLNDIL
jgi:hypothetical protein